MSANTLAMKAIVDNAMYPTLFCDYMSTLIPELEKWYWHLGVGAISFLLIMWLNFYGLDIVGWAQYAFAVAILAPILLLVFMSFPLWNFSKLSPSNQPAEYDFGLLLSNLVWQCTGFDQSTNLAGDVRNPRRTLPISLVLVVFLVIISYFVPIMSAAMAETDPGKWYSGAFAQISLKIPGCENGWLKYWLIISGAVSALSIQNACVTCTSRELYANAHCGLLPFGKWVGMLKTFKKQKQKINEQQNESLQTDDLNNSLNESYAIMDDEEMDESGMVPHWAIVLVSILPVFLMFFDFATLVTLDGFLLIFSLFIQLFFYIYARHGKFGHYSRHPPNGTTFYMHGSPWLTALIVTTPVIVCIALFITNGWLPIVIFVGAQLAMFGLWGIEILVNKRK